MSDNRYPRGTQPGDYYGAPREDYGRDYGSGRDYATSSAREYEAAGQYDRDDRDQGRDAGRGQNRGGAYGQGGGSYGRSDYGQGDYGRGGRDYGNAGYAGSYDRGRGAQQYGQSQGSDRGNYGAQNYGGQDRGRLGQGYGQPQGRDYGRQPQGYDYEERGFFQRAGDEVRSWFGDDDAERRRDMDARYDQREDRGGERDRYANHRDSDYHSWRQGQISQLDRDYDEYRRENRSKFENEFTSWRTNRQGQRDQLGKVNEHMDVVGSDGSHVGTVDKIRGDRIILTKNDADAGGRHHSVPSSWIKEVDTKVTLTKSADQAKKHWRDEERNAAMFGEGETGEGRGDAARDAQGRMLGRSFSGTY